MKKVRILITILILLLAFDAFCDVSKIVVSKGIFTDIIIATKSFNDPDHPFITIWVSTVNGGLGCLSINVKAKTGGNIHKETKEILNSDPLHVVRSYDVIHKALIYTVYSLVSSSRFDWVEHSSAVVLLADFESK